MTPGNTDCPSILLPPDSAHDVLKLRGQELATGECDNPVKLERLLELHARLHFQLLYIPGAGQLRQLRQIYAQPVVMACAYGV